ncbi:MAG: TetR family transcriptional regulator [Aquificota bacterium]|nr:TetR family transcriptional regulator [Aquificota bacterium]
MSGRGESWDLTHTKERIAKVAVRLFSRKGFKGTTMKDIASEVGITEKVPYTDTSRAREDIIRYSPGR